MEPVIAYAAQTFYNHPALDIRPPPPLWLARVTGLFNATTDVPHGKGQAQNAKKPLSLTPVEEPPFGGHPIRGRDQA